ncbi:DUF5518 domain-containing protein [Haloarculaceae archaeon H-GB2-1]|nr:DUF5518 domain-containing protein [Haloarculaceae archaeon H-GB1-1]MEA5389277.1 DUF5518 domain-containing protein [Haloarculaceae archaeon H-GB11]MEA5409913.1 DUF5518 domain-containing protein [Haloarculaceae archaeon H-GB2-1]
MSEGDTLINAVIGAVDTVVLSFTGFSPILGGMVAGYLQRGDRAGGIRVGAISGAIAALPFLLLFFVFGGFLFTGSMMGGGMGVPGGFVVVLLFGFVFALIWSVGLSALGGYLGVYIATETDVGG